MPNPPTPPAQTPVVFVKAGDTNVWFSPDCVKALQEAGLRPEWMGSYDHVAKLNAAARKKVKDWKEGVPGATEPTAEDKYLAHCQSGHLEQNALHQGSRDDPCSNVSPGYDMGAAPCMPQWGHAQQKGGEHYLVSRHEESSAYDASNANPNGGYPATDQLGAPGVSVDSHSRDRLNQVQSYMQGNDPTRAQEVHRLTGDEEKARSNYEKMMREKAAAKESIAKSPTGVDSASGVQTRNTAPDAKGTHVANGTSAAECLDNFRKAAAIAMRQQCKNDVEKNREEDARKSAPNPPPNGESAKQRAHREEQEAKEALEQAKNDPTVSKEQRKRLGGDYVNARNRRITATKHGCLAAQGEQLEASENYGPYDAIIPANAKPFGDGFHEQNNEIEGL